MFPLVMEGQLLTSMILDFQTDTCIYHKCMAAFIESCGTNDISASRVYCVFECFKSSQVMNTTKSIQVMAVLYKSQGTTIYNSYLVKSLTLLFIYEVT